MLQCVEFVSVGSLEGLADPRRTIFKLAFIYPPADPREDWPLYRGYFSFFFPFLLISLETMRLGYLQKTDQKFNVADANYLYCTTSVTPKECSARFPHEGFLDMFCHIFLVLVLNPGFPAINTKFKAPIRKY